MSRQETVASKLDSRHGHNTNTAISGPSKGLNTLPTDSTNLQVTMQHKSGTA